MEDFEGWVWVVRGGGVSSARDRGVVLMRVLLRVKWCEVPPGC